MEASYETLWVKDLPSGLKIIVKGTHVGDGPKSVVYFLASQTKEEIPIKSADVEALMSMSAG